MTTPTKLAFLLPPAGTALRFGASKAVPCALRRSAPVTRRRSEPAWKMTSASDAAETSPSQHRLQSLRAAMQRNRIDALIVPTADPHHSEYPAASFARREYVSGFTGSAGTAVVTKDAALLWTDGRYYLQAEEQLESSWTLMRDGQQGTPTIRAWLAENCERGDRVGVDAFVYTVHDARALSSALEGKDVSLVPMNENLIDEVWGADRPALPFGKLRLHPVEYAGMTAREKIDSISNHVAETGGDVLVISMLDEIAWTLNIRGDDIPHCPVALAYLTIAKSKDTDLQSTLFIDQDKITPDIASALEEASITLAPYKDILSYCQDLKRSERSAILDPFSTSEALRNNLEANGGKKSSVIETRSLVADLKAEKNEAELKGMYAAHERDGAALSEFLCWLESEVQNGTAISEYAAGEQLRHCRAKQDGYIDTSFDTIAGSGPNGAVIHYRAERQDCRMITTEEMLLLDSGGQYVDGTTDVTRTMHFGTPSARERECFTRVLQGHIALDSAVFPEGTTGFQLDPFARQWLWQAGLDYRHGTGHGVGACLNVHEGPQSISPRTGNTTPLKPGMIVSNEPGYYEDGAFGIRIENLLIVSEKDTPNQFNDKKYLGFDRLTFVPLQRKLVMEELLSEREIAWIDQYHADVREKLSPLVSGQTKTWVEQNTQPILPPKPADVGRRGFVAGVMALVSSVIPRSSVSALEGGKLSTRFNEPGFTNKCYLDIAVGALPPSRIVIGLYGGVVPRTTKNFVELCLGADGLTYRGSEVYRIVQGLTVQAGDIAGKNGEGGQSIYGEFFEAENFKILHDSVGIVSMVKRKDGKVDSRFFITTRDESGYLEDKYVGFGRVIEGLQVLRQLDRESVTGPSNKPKRKITIVDCGTQG